MLWKKKRKSELAVRALYPRPEGRGFTAQVINILRPYKALIRHKNC